MGYKSVVYILYVIWTTLGFKPLPVSVNAWASAASEFCCRYFFAVACVTVFLVHSFKIFQPIMKSCWPCPPFRPSPVVFAGHPGFWPPVARQSLPWPSCHQACEPGRHVPLPTANTLLMSLLLRGIAFLCNGTLGRWRPRCHSNQQLPVLQLRWGAIPSFIITAGTSLLVPGLCG